MLVWSLFPSFNFFFFSYFIHVKIAQYHESFVFYLKEKRTLVEFDTSHTCFSTFGVGLTLVDLLGSVVVCGVVCGRCRPVMLECPVGGRSSADVGCLICL